MSKFIGILEFDGSKFESFALGDDALEADKNLKYWFDRRIEKSNKEANRGFIIPSECEVDVKKWRDEYWAEYSKNLAIETEMKEKQIYEMLRKKFEK